MVLANLFQRSELRKSAGKLYGGIVKQARNRGFYADLDVPDTVDGRFDMIALHAALVMRRLKSGTGRSADLSQALFDTLFDDMDRSLREMGAGDLGVGRRVKAMARAFYGRLAAYDEGLAGDDRALGNAIERNLYRGAPPDAAKLAALSAYVRREAAALDGQMLDDLLAGRLDFGAPPN